MAVQDLSTVLEVLPRLNYDELKQLKLKVGAKLSLSVGGSSPPTQTQSDYVKDGIITELRRRGLLGTAKGLSPRQLPNDFDAASAEIQEFLAGHVGVLSAVRYAALGQLAARALASFLENQGKQVTAWLLTTSVSKIPQALDAAYPGYLEAGLLAFCWRDR
jgi:hypothetical protein